MAQAVHQGFFGFVPQLVRANAGGRAGRHLVEDVGETEVSVDLLEHLGEGVALGQDLVFGAEDVAVVLREATHAHDAVQATRRLVAVTLAELAVAQRQVAVAFDALLEDQNVARTVHRLQGVVALFRLGGEHVLAVLVPVPGFFPQALVDDLRAFDLQIAVVAVDLTHVLLHALPHRPALGVPEHQTRCMLVDVEQVEFTAELAVVAFFGFLQAQQVLLQVFLAGPGGAIHALQHLVLAVATPVGAGHFHEFEVLELAGAGHMRATAEIFKITFAVEADLFTGRNRTNDFGLVMLAQPLEVGHGLVARQHAAHHRFVLGGQLGHALFDRHEVLGRERTAVREIVIKAVVDHRTDGDLRLGEQLLDGIGQQVGGGVTNHLQPFGVLGGHDGQPGVLLDAKAGVDQLAIDLAAERGLGQAGAYGRCHFGHGHRTGKLTLGTVGKSDLKHVA